MNYAMPMKYAYDRPEYEAKNCRDAAVWPTLAQIPSLKVITLYRENAINQYLSFKRLRLEAQFKEQAPTTFKIDVPHLLRYITNKEELEKIALARFPNAYVLTYEDLQNRYSHHAGKMQEYLGVNPTRLGARSRIIHHLPLSQEITNYDEVASALKETSYAKYVPLKS